MLERLISNPVLAQADVSPEFAIVLLVLLVAGSAAAVLLLKKARAKKDLGEEREEREEPTIPEKKVEKPRPVEPRPEQLDKPRVEKPVEKPRVEKPRVEKPAEKPRVEKPRVEKPAEKVPEKKVDEPLLKIPEGRTLAEGLARTKKEGFVARLTGIFKKELDDELEARVEEVLLTSDIGVKTANKLLENMKDSLSKDELRQAEPVWNFLKKEIGDIMTAASRSRDERRAERGERPACEVILVVGVNGAGKTTSIGKLAAYHVNRGRKVMLIAGDTFRAAAVEQLKIWSDRAGTGFYRGADEADPASVIFDGLKQGFEQGYDLILVDTAGRLHTKTNLVEELKKIHRVSGKAIPSAPHQVLLVLDATNGQNALQQADVFGNQVSVDGIILSKLDGTAKGGVVIGICDTFGIPVTWVGTGEKAEDLREFNPDEFVKVLFDLA